MNRIETHDAGGTRGSALRTSVDATDAQSGRLSPRLRRWIRFAGTAAAIAVIMWYSRQSLLTAAGRMLVSENAPTPVDVIAVSNATSVSDVLEAAHLYHGGIAPLIIFPTARPEAYDEELRRIGTPRLSPAEYATWLLELSGVPPDAVHPLQTVTDGTETSIAAIATYVRETAPGRVLYVTARDHTTRARWLLRRELPPATTVLLRSPRTDDFDPTSWWHSRWASREVAMEYLRWVNTFVLGDLWANEPEQLSVKQAAAEK